MASYEIDVRYDRSLTCSNLLMFPSIFTQLTDVLEKMTVRSALSDSAARESSYLKARSISYLPSNWRTAPG